jgi:DNA replication protein DnaC
VSAECPNCNGTGFQLSTGDAGVVSSVRCSCTAEKHTERLLVAAHIPARYAHCGFDSFELHHASHGRALECARRWVELFPIVDHGLMFLGQPGRGKTHLAVAIAGELIRIKGAQVRFYEQRALLKALQGTFESGSNSRESEVLRPVLDVDVLILDDLGAGRTTMWARDVIHDIIAHRYNEQKTLIITTNLLTGEKSGAQGATAKALDTPLTLKDRLGDALMSRLHEMCQIVPMGGMDYRSGVLAQKTRY